MVHRGPSAAYIDRQRRVIPRAEATLMISELYNEKILDFAANIPRLGRLARPDGSASVRSRLCGSTVAVDVAVEDGKVADFAHDVRACALGQASSSIMARHVLGSSLEELRELRDRMRAMLKENGDPPTGKWADLAYLQPVRDHRARHASTMLTFEATVEAFENALAAESGGAPDLAAAR
jgi:NifU-like protein involved in Fe-S cluster formation